MQHPLPELEDGELLDKRETLKRKDPPPDWRKDSGERILSLSVKVGNRKINLVNIYVPTNLTESKVFFENLHEFILPVDGVIIGSDFNCY